MPCGCETRVFSLKLIINNPNESQGKLYIAHRLEPKLKSEIMNNVNSHNGQGGFQSVSFRVCDCAVPEPRMKCSENVNTSYCGICSKSLRFNIKEFMENIKSDRIHFLDTPAGRKWENIVAWRIAQKENKKK